MCADIQHPQVILKAVHGEVSGVDTHLIKGLLKRDIAIRAAARQDKIRLTGKELFKIQLLRCAQMHDIVPQRQIIIGPCGIRCCNNLLRAARKTPDIRKAGNQASHPLWVVYRHLTSEIIGKGYTRFRYRF